MTNKIIFIIFAFSVFIFAAAVGVQGVANVSYPIPELGNCGSQEECKIFCDSPVNYVACTEWAVKNGLEPKEKVAEVKKEVEQVEKFEKGEISEGPGGCRTPEECDAYCAQPEHGEECFKFGLEHNLISPEEAKQIQEQVEKIKGPGGCQTNDECEAFCAKPENAEVCVSYGVEEGTLAPAEAAEIMRIMGQEKEKRMKRPEGKRPKSLKPQISEEKVIKVLEKQKGPGGCSTPQECKEYCDNLDHAEECLSFAEENNLAPPKELDKVKKLMKLGGPSGCKGPKECDQYCSLPEHQMECLEFAQKNGLVSPEESEMMKKMAGGGPGGCRTPTECDAYCGNPQHMEECLMFSVQQGLMSREDAQKMIEIMKKQEIRGLEMKGTPPPAEKSSYKEMPHMFEKGMPKENEWHGRGDEERGQMVPEDFMKNQGPMMPQEHQMMPETAPQYQEMSGPGGCKSKAECDAYCAQPEHIKECTEFSGGGGNSSENQQMPKNYMPPSQGYENMPPEGIMEPPEGMMPPQEEAAPPEETSPLPEESPQSLFDQLKNFLANISALIRF